MKNKLKNNQFIKNLLPGQLTLTEITVLTPPCTDRWHSHQFDVNYKSAKATLITTGNNKATLVNTRNNNDFKLTHSQADWR